ncbi:MAG: hypothetical protein VKJ04_10155 [Vampirovibrionales bacterium]|nr:hypothetical protein [Vampirovibrionales bacterium]
MKLKKISLVALAAIISVGAFIGSAQAHDRDDRGWDRHKNWGQQKKWRGWQNNRQQWKKRPPQARNWNNQRRISWWDRDRFDRHDRDWDRDRGRRGWW